MDNSILDFLKELEDAGFKINIKPEDNTKFLVENPSGGMLKEEWRKKLIANKSQILSIVSAPRKATLKHFGVEGHFIKRPKEVFDIFEKLKKQEWISYDYETTGLNPHKDKIRLAQFYDSIERNAYCFDMYAPGMKEALTKELMTIESYRLWAANAGFESAFTDKQLGVRKIVLCIQVLERYVRSSELNVKFRYALDDLALRYLTVYVDKTYQTSDWSSEILTEGQIEYALLDAVLTHYILNMQIKLLGERWLDSKSGFNFKTLCSCLRTYTLSSSRGVRVNKQEIERSIDVRRADIDDLAKEILQATGLNYSHKTKYPIKEHEFKKWLKEKYPGYFNVLEDNSLDADNIIKSLSSSNVVIPDIMYAWSKYKKAIKQHSDAKSFLQLVKEGRISYSAAVGKQDTGRVSLFKPALNTLSRNTAEWSPRNWVIPEEGEVLLEIDAAQQEAMLLALAINNQPVIEALKNGIDLHKYAAAKIYNVPIEAVTKEQRTFGKQANLSLGYAMRSKTFRSRLIQNLKKYFTFSEARNIWNGWRKAFPEIVAAHATVHKQALQDGYVESVGGRRYISADISENKAINYKVQPSAADALYLVVKELAESEFAVHLLFSVHDSWIFSLPRNKVEKVKSFMLEAYKKALILLFPNIELDFFERVNLLDYKESEISWGGGTQCVGSLSDQKDWRGSFFTCFYDKEKHSDQALEPGIYSAKITNVLTGDVSGKGNIQCIINAMVDYGEDQEVGDVREITTYITYEGPKESKLFRGSWVKINACGIENLNITQQEIKDRLSNKDVIVCCYRNSNSNFNEGLEYIFFPKQDFEEDCHNIIYYRENFKYACGQNFEEVLNQYLARHTDEC